MKPSSGLRIGTTALLALLIASCNQCPSQAPTGGTGGTGGGTPGGGGGGTPPPPPPIQLFVTNLGGNSVVSFGLDNNGIATMPPYRRIQGASTGLHNPMAVSAPRSGEIFVANLGDNASGPSVTIFAEDATGNVQPLRTLEGANTGLSRPNGIRAGQWPGFLVTNHVEQGGSGILGVVEYGVGVGNGDPTGRISGASTTITGPMGMARGPNNEVVLADATTNRILIYDFPANTTHDAAPTRVVGGANTGLDRPMGAGFDSSGVMYVVNHGSSTITVYAAGAQGDVAPIRVIRAQNTAPVLHEPSAIAVDDPGHVYVSMGNIVLVYDAGANGAANPIQVIDDPALSGTQGLCIR